VNFIDIVCTLSFTKNSHGIFKVFTHLNFTPSPLPAPGRGRILRVKDVGLQAPGRGARGAGGSNRQPRGGQKALSRSSATRLRRYLTLGTASPTGWSRCSRQPGSEAGRFASSEKGGDQAAPKCGAKCGAIPRVKKML
jgi:hypothetical protein